jgi:hypothetical protein
MNRLYRWISYAVFVPLVLVSALSGGCRAKPQVICVMENPVTSQRVEMCKESRLKVPAAYDEQQHIEQWKAEQRKKGFTDEVKP